VEGKGGRKGEKGEREGKGKEEGKGGYAPSARASSFFDTCRRPCAFLPVFITIFWRLCSQTIPIGLCCLISMGIDLPTDPDPSEPSNSHSPMHGRRHYSITV